MFLIAESTADVGCIVEANAEGKKTLYIEGRFMAYGEANKNGRIYSEPVMRREVERYTTECIGQKRAYGELNHPEGPQINLDKVSHLIEKLEVRANGTVYGKARILETPLGNIARGLLDGGANLGVSSRGLGSLRQGQNGIMEVQGDFRLVTAADIVADPSGPSCFVNGIMEGVEYFYGPDGSIQSRAAQQIRDEIDAIGHKKLDEQAMLSFLSKYLKTL